MIIFSPWRPFGVIINGCRNEGRQAFCTESEFVYPDVSYFLDASYYDSLKMWKPYLPNLKEYSTFDYLGLVQYCMDTKYKSLQECKYAIDEYLFDSSEYKICNSEDELKKVMLLV